MAGGGSTCVSDPATGLNNCTPSDSTSVADVLMVLLLAAVIVAPLITTMYLGYRLRHRQARATA
jgi:hypothetical protein